MTGSAFFSPSGVCSLRIWDSNGGIQSGVLFYGLGDARTLALHFALCVWRGSGDDPWTMHGSPSVARTVPVTTPATRGSCVPRGPRLFGV